MNIKIAGCDRTQDLGPELRSRAVAMGQGDDHHRPAEVPPGIAALSLAQARNEAEFVARLVQLLRHRDAVDASKFHNPRRPGLLNLCKDRLRTFLWQLLRYQRDRVVFRQNLINTQLTSALALESMQRQQVIEDLQKRVAELESQANGGAK